MDTPNYYKIISPLCTSALENKLMGNRANHVEVNDDKQHQNGQYKVYIRLLVMYIVITYSSCVTEEVNPQQPPKPKRPPQELIQQSRNQQKSHGFLHGLFGL